MMMRQLGDTGVPIPAVGQGTWRMGESPTRAAEEINALRLGIDHGLTLIDTAEMYADGGAERIVAEAIAGRRDEVFIVSKVLPENASYEGVQAAAKRSLKRLKTDRIDLYLLHWPSHRHPLEETMRGLERLVEGGLIRFLGISNFDARGTQEARSHLKKHPLVCNQVLYHLKERGVEYSLLPYCQERRITLMAYSPFGQGDFPAPDSPGGRVLADVAARHGKTPRQVALNFLTRHPSVVAIPKASTAEHVLENAGAVGWELTDEDVAAINEAFPPPKSETPLAVL